MGKKSSVLLRAGALGFLTAAIPLGIYAYYERSEVNTEAMLDVSVSIKTISHVRIDKVGDSVWSAGSGSGFLVSSEDCEVWTNHHVVDDAASIEVFPRGWKAARGIPATVVNSTPRSDLAILRMENCADIAQAKLGDSDAVRPGSETFAVGNPLGRNPDSISQGIISHTERYASGPIPYLQTDASINLGNSGGALFNRKGEVIGVNAAIAATRGGSNTGIGYAIPINLVKEETAALHQGPPSWGDAGIGNIISMLTVDEAAIFGAPEGYGGISLSKDPTEGPAVDKLFARDVIFKINDTGLTGVAQAKRIISNHDADETVSFHVVRDGETKVVPIQLAEGWKDDESKDPEYYEGHLGMTLEMWAEEEGEKGAFKTPVITMVQSLGPAHRGHIMSSQKNVGFKGPFVTMYQMDVKTITGVVYRSKYYPVEDVEDINQFAALAYEDDSPLLLEIEMWGRPSPKKFEEPLQHVGTAFYKIQPTATNAARPVDDDETDEDSPFDHPGTTAARSTQSTPDSRS